MGGLASQANLASALFSLKGRRCNVCAAARLLDGRSFCLGTYISTAVRNQGNSWDEKEHAGIERMVT